MPKEFVYKVIIDDSDVPGVLDKTEKRLETLGVKAQQSFAAVGSTAQASFKGINRAAEDYEKGELRRIANIRAKHEEARKNAEFRESERARREKARSKEVEQSQIAAIRSFNEQHKGFVAEQKAREREVLDVIQEINRDRSDAARAEQERQRSVAASQKQAITDFNQKHKQHVNERKARDKEVQAVLKDIDKDRAKSAKDEINRQKTVSKSQQQAIKDFNNRHKSFVKERTARDKRVLGVLKEIEKERKDAAKADSKRQKQSAARQREANRQFTRTVKTFSTQRNALNQLAQKYGTFNVTIRRSGQAMNQLEKEVQDVIRSDKDLAREIDRITQKQGDFNATIDRARFAGGRQPGIPQGQFRQIGFAAQRFGIPGAAAFGEIIAVAGAAGVAIGGVLLAVQGVTKAFTTMGRIAVNALTDIVRNSIEIRQEFELTEAQFRAIFEGNEAAAQAAVQRLRRLSIELGEDVLGIGRAFLPEVGSLDELEEIVKIATALARFQPEQGAIGARIALQEAFSGETISLKKRFEIPASDLKKIQDALSDRGIIGFIEEMNAWLERTGRSIEDLSDTSSVGFNRIKQSIRDLGDDLGRPIVDELKTQFEDFFDLLDDKRESLRDVATGIGLVGRNLLQVIGVNVQDFGESLDFGEFLRIINAINDVLLTIAGRLEQLVPAATALESVAGSFEKVAEIVDFLDKASIVIDDISSSFVGNVGLIDRLAASFGVNLIPALFEGVDLFGEGTDVVKGFAQGVAIVSGALEGATSAAGIFARNFFRIIEGARPAEDVLNEMAFVTLKAMDDNVAAVNKAWEENADITEEMIEEYQDLGDVSDELADKLLLITQLTKQLTEAQNAMAESSKEINEALRDFNEDAAARFEKLLVDAQRASLETEIGNAQKRIDIEIANLERLEDIRSKFADDLEKQARTLTDKEFDVLKKHSRAIAELEINLAKERLEVEKDYQERLEDIRDRFNFQASEAILANDIKRLREIRRRQAFEEKEAKKQRDRGLKEVDSSGTERREKLNRQLENELEDAQLANDRRVRELEISLQKQFDAQETARLRDIAGQTLAEERKTAALKLSLDQQLEDYRTWWDERALTTEREIADELERYREMAAEEQRILAELAAAGAPTPGSQIIPGIMTAPQGLGRSREDMMQEILSLVRPGSGIPADILKGIEDKTVEELLSFLNDLRSQLGLPQIAGTFAPGVSVPQAAPALPPGIMPEVSLDPEGRFGMVNPLVSFDAEAFKENLDTQAEEQALTELEKRGEIEDTQAFAEQVAADTTKALLQQLGIQTSDVEGATDDQLKAFEEMLSGQDEALGENYEDRLEGEADFEEDKADLIAKALQGDLELNSDFWTELFRVNSQAMTADLELVAEWVRQRQILTAQGYGLGGPQPGGSAPPPGGGSSDGGGGNLRRMTALAYEYGAELGFSTSKIAAIIQGLGLDELSSLVRDWLEQLKELGLRQLGGSVLPGQSVLVGEGGIPEIVRGAGALQVDPLSALLFRNAPPTNIGGNVTNIDRSSNFGGFNFPDPRGIPPTYTAAMENIAARVVKKAWSSQRP